MKRYILLMIVILIFIIPHHEVSATSIRAEWTEVNYTETVLLNNDWFIDVRITNRTTLLAGYTMSVDGVVVQYEYFQSNPARGTFVIKYLFEEDVIPEGEHSILLILLPMDNSVNPYYYEDIYDMTVDVQKTLEGTEFLIMSIIILAPFLLLMLYGYVVVRFNKIRVENINVANFIPFMVSLRRARKDIISHREGRAMKRRYIHFNDQVKQYIKRVKPAGVRSYILLILFLILCGISVVFFTAKSLWILPVMVDTGIEFLPHLNLPLIFGIFFIIVSVIPLLFWYIAYTDRYFDNDIYLENPAEFVKMVRDSSPTFNPMTEMDVELSDIDDALVEIINTRKKLEELFNIEVGDIKAVKKKRVRPYPEINMDIDLNAPVKTKSHKKPAIKVIPKRK